MPFPEIEVSKPQMVVSRKCWANIILSFMRFPATTFFCCCCTCCACAKEFLPNTSYSGAPPASFEQHLGLIDTIETVAKLIEHLQLAAFPNINCQNNSLSRRLLCSQYLKVQKRCLCGKKEKRRRLICGSAPFVRGASRVANQAVLSRPA